MPMPTVLSLDPVVLPAPAAISTGTSTTSETAMPATSATPSSPRSRATRLPLPVAILARVGVAPSAMVRAARIMRLWT